MSYTFTQFDSQEIEVPSEQQAIAIKLDNFCSQQKKTTLHYPAFFYKGKSGAFFERICMEPKFGLPKTEQNYSSYRGVYFDFNYEEQNITMFIDGTETLYFNKNNVTHLKKEITESSEAFFCQNYIIHMIQEEYENVSSIPYIMSRFSEDTLELSLFLVYEMSQEEKNVIFNFFKIFE